MRRTLLLLTALLLLSSAQALDVTTRDQTIYISGSAGPGQPVDLSSTLQMEIPVIKGSYEYTATGVEIPVKPNRFSVTVSGVDDLNVGVKIGIFISRRIEASGGSATISRADIPPGRYTIRIFGQAASGQSVVKATVRAETQIKAGNDGAYAMEIDTRGLPAGEYRVEAGGDGRTISVGLDQETDSGADSPDERPAVRSALTSAGLPVTKEVVAWYAARQGADPSDPADLAEAEKNLRRMTADRSWLVLSQYQNLTEECGTCQDFYCLVRGAGACTTCRDKCISVNPNESATAQLPVLNSSINKTASQEQPNSFWSWLWQILGVPGAWFN